MLEFDISMLSKLFRRATAAPNLEASAPVETFGLFARPNSRFAIPDWRRGEESLAARFMQEDPIALWTKVSLCWMHSLKESLGDGFRISSSDNFHFLSPGTAREQQLFLEYAEKSRKRTLRLLDGIAKDEGYGKSCVMAFAGEEQYYEYVANYYPDEGEFALSGGMYINHGYGHFVCVKVIGKSDWGHKSDWGQVLQCSNCSPRGQSRIPQRNLNARLAISHSIEKRYFSESKGAAAPQYRHYRQSLISGVIGLPKKSLLRPLASMCPRRSCRQNVPLMVLISALRMPSFPM